VGRIIVISLVVAWAVYRRPKLDPARAHPNQGLLLHDAG
jgi:hypothetical protein